MNDVNNTALLLLSLSHHILNDLLDFLQVNPQSKPYFIIMLPLHKC
jgi:hypothetical protein